MPLNQELSDFEWGRVIGYWECKKTTREIAEALGHTQSQIFWAIDAFRKEQQVTVKSRNGQPKVLTERNLRQLSKAVVKNRQNTLDELAQSINKVSTVLVSSKTISRRLHELGFHSLVGVRKPFISEANASNGVKKDKIGLPNLKQSFGVMNLISVYFKMMLTKQSGVGQKKNTLLTI